LRDSLSKMFANVVTILNIIFGTLAITYILAQEYRTAALLVLVAVIMDGADGRIARKLDSTSELGKELDSLCDLVSFGVAPAILLYSQVLQSHYHTLGLMVCILFVVCGALRLARFNILNISEYFLGIPITIAGLLLALFVPVDQLRNSKPNHCTGHRLCPFPLDGEQSEDTQTIGKHGDGPVVRPHASLALLHYLEPGFINRLNEFSPISRTCHHGFFPAQVNLGLFDPGYFF
jgi:CDP-diacylglycerol--serine O-phosphatidyltransferase (EC 2.7.8.8)